MNTKPLKLYLDTSVPSFLLASDDPDKQAITQELFKKTSDKSKYSVLVFKNGCSGN